jgi:hypothetical protein
MSGRYRSARTSRRVRGNGSWTISRRLLASRRLDVPMIVGSAGDTGSNSRVDLFVGIIRDLARNVNAGEKMHQRAGVKLHHGWMPNAPTGGLLLRDKQNEKCVASPANVPETSSVA